jgi:hypothetical protein
MATYYVSGIWTNNKIITDLNIHLVSDGVHMAKKYTLAKAIELVEASNEVYTCNWNYPNPSWNKGARVHVVKEGNQKYLRSNHDKLQKDNLDNMLPMTNLGF